MKTILLLCCLLTFYKLGSSQIPLYYKFKKVEGTIYNNNQEIYLKFHSRRKLIIENCKDANIDTLLRTLALGRIGRKQLEHLLNSKAKIEINVLNKIGVAKYNNEYWIMGGINVSY